MQNPVSIIPNCSERLQAYATMPISLHMLPMLLVWQASRVFRKCCGLPSLFEKVYQETAGVPEGTPAFKSMFREVKVFER